MATIWRLHRVQEETGKGRSAVYEDIRIGMMPRPIKLGLRAVGIPADEVEAVNKARIAGKSTDEIKSLVRRLEAARSAEAV